MSVIEIAKIQIRRGQENTTGIPQLDPGEFGWAEDTQHLYIGKRIAEGANTDANTRILTEIDLGELQSLLGNASTTTITSLYNYRANIDYINTVTQHDQRFLQSKLDDIVNLKDFVGSSSPFSSGTDITTYLRTAITTLYANEYTANTSEPRRRLMIPAGNYVISNTIDLPPYAELVGEGQDVTTLISNMSSGNTFRTIDALGTNFGGSMQNGSGASRGVQISNMTLAYAENNANPNAIISLDNTEDAKIENITFTTMGTSSFVATGTGIDIQANFNITGVDESSAVAKNPRIANCQFTSLYSGINSRGLISRPVFENNVFTNLSEGVNFTGYSGGPGPTNVLITQNKFEFIQSGAVNADTSTNQVISSENVYYYVGNGGSIPDQWMTSSTNATPVLTFAAPGNISSNDYFNRKVVAGTTSTYYYNPLISGNARINSAATYNVSLTANTNDQPVLYVPLTGTDQMGIIEYQLYNTDMSRKGKLTLNISPDGYASVSDYYNFSEITTGSHQLLVFSTDYTSGVDLNYITVTCSNFSNDATSVEYNLDLIV